MAAPWLRTNSIAQFARATANLARMINLAQTVQDFFVAYNEVQGKKFKPLGIHGPDRALRVIRDSLAQQRKKGRQKS